MNLDYFSGRRKPFVSVVNWLHANQAAFDRFHDARFAYMLRPSIGNLTEVSGLDWHIWKRKNG